MAKYLVETYYNCSFKVSHYLDKVDEKEYKEENKKEEKGENGVRNEVDDENEERKVQDNRRITRSMDKEGRKGL